MLYSRILKVQITTCLHQDSSKLGAQAVSSQSNSSYFLIHVSNMIVVVITAAGPRTAAGTAPPAATYRDIGVRA